MTASKTMVLSFLAACLTAGAALASPANPQCGDDHGDKKEGKKDGEKKPTT